MLAVVAWTAGAPAQPLDATQRRAVAQALFDEAQKLMSEGNYSLACIKLEEVVRLQPGKIGALFTLARCYEGEGKIASAWSRYKNAADAARVAKDARLDEAEKKIGELESKVAKLTITVGISAGAIAGLHVLRDGLEVSPAQWGVAVPVDAGEHHLEVTAPGRKPWKQEVTLTDGNATTVEVPELEAAEVAPLPTLKPTALPTAGPADTAPGAVLGLPRRTWGVIVFGVGAAGLVMGGVTGGLAVSQHDALKAVCPNGRCSEQHRGDVEAYELFGTLSTIGLIAGGVLTAAGVTLWLTAPKAGSPGVALYPYAGPASAGFLGRF